MPSPFFLETGLTQYEPACIESAMLSCPVPLAELLDGVSYADSWLAQPCPDANAQGRLADTCICVFAPNQLAHPQCSALHPVGCYLYEVKDEAPSSRP